MSSSWCLCTINHAVVAGTRGFGLRGPRQLGDASVARGQHGSEDLASGGGERIAVRVPRKTRRSKPDSTPARRSAYFAGKRFMAFPPGLLGLVYLKHPGGERLIPLWLRLRRAM